ncbi:MAG: energy-coupling factor transporter ATPase [Firmicutes bacterium]|nr:energy-coupling factor transporter ATPase [Bacillota bacterium]
MDMVKSEKLKYEYTFETAIDEEEREPLVALKGVDITIEKGMFVAILGRNGSGKSTFAKHLNALLTPTEGTLFVNGYDCTQEELIYKIRKSAGMVFQNPDNQLVSTIVEEDIAFGPENLCIESSEIRKRVDRALKTVNMTEYARYAPNKLSGGQKQRIAIAGILAMEPECIVLDEPTAMLDPEGRKEVIDTVMELNKEKGITIILITHYMEEAIKADKIFVMDGGTVIMEGTPKEVFSQVEKLKGIGLDVPQVTEVAYRLRKRGIDIPQDILSIEEMVCTICQLKSKI